MTTQEFINTYDFDKVYRNGWGLHPETSKFIIKIIDKIKNVVEFGSGGSTKLLLDIKEMLGYVFHLDSFDHNEKFAFKAEKNHENFNLNIRHLVKYEEAIYKQMFLDKKISNEKTNVIDDIFNTRLVNCFYDIKDGDLKEEYDLVILDGPNGNGRNIAYLHLIEKLKPGTIVIIDDFDHYDFVEKCQYMFDVEIIEKRKFDHPLKGHCILKIN